MKNSELIQEINNLKLMIEELKRSMEELKNKQAIHYHYHYEKQTISQPFNPTISPYNSYGGTGTFPNTNIPSNTTIGNNNPYHMPDFSTSTITNYTLKPGDSLTFTDNQGNTKTLGLIKVVHKPDFNMN